MDSIKNMPYFKNEAAKSGDFTLGHEAAIAVKFKECAFNEEFKITYPKLSKKILKTWARSGNESDLESSVDTMPFGTFILQPSGSQGFPDMLVRDFNGRFIAIEAKSSGTGYCPMWNDSLPNPNTIYVLASGVLNETTIFLGKDVITPEELTLMAQQHVYINSIVADYNQKLAQFDKFNRGFVQKSRPQHFQFGGDSKSNYFTHSDRAQCETNVMEFALQ